MADEDSKKVADELDSVVRQVKPGFEVVPKTRGPANACRPTMGTPDVSVLHSKARALGIRGRSAEADAEEAAMSEKTDSLMQKYLKKGSGSADAPATASKSRGRILNVRPTDEDTISEDERAPKDLRVVVDDKGKLGESS
jgi:hypothetical protein